MGGPRPVTIQVELSSAIFSRVLKRNCLALLGFRIPGQRKKGVKNHPRDRGWYISRSPGEVGSGGGEEGRDGEGRVSTLSSEV